MTLGACNIPKFTRKYDKNSVVLIQYWEVKLMNKCNHVISFDKVYLCVTYE